MAAVGQQNPCCDDRLNLPWTSREAEILIDDENAILGPAEFHVPCRQRILALRRFAICVLRGLVYARIPSPPD